MTRCPGVAELTDFAAGSVTVSRREAIAAHLVGCDSCAGTVRELRTVSARVRAAAPAPQPSQDLAARLVAIAGEQARDPLIEAPFRADRRRTLPRPRRRLRQGLAALAGALALTTAGLTGLAYAAAGDVPRVDPAKLARATGPDSWQVEALPSAALALARLSEPTTTAAAMVSPRLPQEWTEPDPAGLLQRAATAARTRAYAGEQLVQIARPDGCWRVTAHLAARPGGGVEVTLEPATARLARFVALPAEDALASFVAAHDLQAGPGGLVAERPTVVVQALAQGQVRARWWLDRDTGLVLWQQTLVDGMVIDSTGFTTVDLEASPPDHLAPLLMPDTGDVAATEVFPQRAAGLQRVSVRRTLQGAVATYTDGAVTVTAYAVPGALVAAPQGFVWDPSVGAHRSVGLPEMLTWQSADTVFAVVSESSGTELSQVAHMLPHDPPAHRGPTERIADGWKRVTTMIGER